MESISQSIATHGGVAGGKKSQSDNVFSAKSKDDRESGTGGRFRVAASRILHLYAITLGYEAANLLCTSLCEDLSQEDQDITGPRTAAWKMLQSIKSTSMACALLFGGPRRAGPLPGPLDDEFASYTMSRQSKTSGLAFDIERMFEEKVVVFPHPSEISDFDRNQIVVQQLKVCFKACSESVRLAPALTLSGYRQLLADTEFLKWMISHYVKDETLPDGSNSRSGLETLLAKSVSAAKDRLPSDLQNELSGETDEINAARAAVRSFMSENADEIVLEFVIEDD